MRHPTLCLLALAGLFFDLNQPARAVPPATSAALRQVDAEAWPNLFVWTDTCNVYVLRDGAAALLIDLGDGSVLDHLPAIGVQRVEWVLFTHHHREQCQGDWRLKGTGARVAAPEKKRRTLGATQLLK